MAMYGKLEYWEERYTHTGDIGAYDWYQTYGSLRHLLNADILTRPLGRINSLQDRSSRDLQSFGAKTPLFPSREKCRVLILGCGNSTFGGDMRNDGWTGEIVNVDFSSVVIDQMMKKHESKHEREGKHVFPPKMKFVCADITHGLPFKDNDFDLIICKGTFDSILCSSGSVTHAKKLVAECERVLATGHGCLFLVSYGSPDNRVVFLEHENDPSYYWQGIGIRTVPRQNQAESKNDYVYICRKKGDGTEEVGNKGISQAPKRLDEENFELIVDHNTRKTAQAGDSYY